MNPYLYLVIAAILPVTIMYGKRRNIQLSIFCWLVVAVAISGFRGNFTADANNYRDIFYQYSLMDWSQIKGIFNWDYNINVMETGFALLNFLVSRVTDNYLWMQILTTLITIVPIFLLIRKSPYIFLSISLYMGIGTYLEGFNTIRNVMAASLAVFTIKYIRERKLLQYCIVVFLISLIHFSALILLPMYFVLNFKPRIKTIIVCAISLLIGVKFIEELADLYNYYFKFSATAQRTLELLYRNQAEFRGIGIAVILVCITLIFYLFYYIKNKDEQNNTSADSIFFNGVLIWGILKIAMLYSGYATRFASYFSFYIYLFLPYVLKKVNIKEKNKKAIALIIASLCLWAFLTASKAYGSYYSIFM